MSTPDQVAFYHTQAWLRCRDAYARSVGGLCERCKARGVTRPGYIVHHREHISLENITDPDILLSWDNLEYLCQSCHNLLHHSKNISKRYEVGEDGKIFIIDDD